MRCKGSLFLLFGLLMAWEGEPDPVSSGELKLSVQGGRLGVQVEAPLPDGLMLDIFIHRMEEVLDRGELRYRKGDVQKVFREFIRGGKMQVPFNLLPSFGYRVSVLLDPDMQRPEIRERFRRNPPPPFRLEKETWTGFRGEEIERIRKLLSSCSKAMDVMEEKFVRCRESLSDHDTWKGAREALLHDSRKTLSSLQSFRTRMRFRATTQALSGLGISLRSFIRGVVVTKNGEVRVPKETHVDEGEEAGDLKMLSSGNNLGIDGLMEEAGLIRRVFARELGVFILQSLRDPVKAYEKDPASRGELAGLARKLSGLFEEIRLDEKDHVMTGMMTFLREMAEEENKLDDEGLFEKMMKMEKALRKVFVFGEEGGEEKEEEEEGEEGGETKDEKPGQ